jgi:hypothetical protein
MSEASETIHDADQAEHTASLCSRAGSREICGICGDADSRERALVREDGSVFAVRVCADREAIQTLMYGARFEGAVRRDA